MIILSWMKEIQHFYIMILFPLLVDALGLKQLFDNITFTHVYRERNGIDDRFSKEGTQLPLGSWKVEEHSQG